MNKVKLFFLVNLLLLVYISQGQNLGLNKTGTTADPSAALDINFTDAGLLIPRMTTTQRNAITSPANSLLIFNTTTACFETYNSATSTWQSVFCMCTIPSAPTALAASGITGTSFTANWTASAGATTYYLDVATDAGFTSFVPGYNNLNVGNNVSYNVTGLSASTTYYYRVRASNSCGTSGNSNTISVATTSCYTPGSQTLSYAGAQQTWTVPCGVTTVTLTVRGAQGANASDRLPGNTSGGLGGSATGALSVTVGQILYVYVGGQGNTNGTGGWNGGGTGGNGIVSDCFGGPAGGGGGASDIRVGGTAWANIVIAGGGGGGAGRDYCNGSCQPCGCGGGNGGGGGTTGINGGAAYNCGYGYPGSGVNGGGGGTQVSGGAGGTGDGGGNNGTAGGQLSGGTGANGNYDVAGGGGGGGYYGGGGGGGASSGSGVGGGGGGGGSSYIGGVTGGSTSSAVQSGNGQVIISW